MNWKFSIFLTTNILFCTAFPLNDTPKNVVDGVEYPFPLADIILTPSQKRYFLTKNDPQKSGIDFGKYPTKKWANNKIIYDLGSSYQPWEVAMIEKGQEMISNKTCLQFVKRTSETDYVKIMRGSGCNSFLGRLGGAQVMNLGSGCLRPGTVAHEFLHSAGVIHQHQRADRDDSIQVNWDNIPKDWWQWFEKWTTTSYVTYGVEYRVDSIMHYASNTPGYWTNSMTSLVGHQNEMGQREDLTEEDALLVNRMYDC